MEGHFDIRMCNTAKVVFQSWYFDFETFLLATCAITILSRRLDSRGKLMSWEQGDN